MTQFSKIRVNTAVLSEIGARLKKRRLAFNLSREFLAERTGLSRSTIERL